MAAHEKATGGPGMSGPPKTCYEDSLYQGSSSPPKEEETGLLGRKLKRADSASSLSRKEYGKYDGGPPCILWFKRCFNDKAEGEICDRTKNAANIWANAWYVGVALNMTLGVALLNNFDPGSATQRSKLEDWQFEIARYSYLFLVLHGVVFATLGVIASAYTVIDTASVPAIAYPEYYAVLCEEYKDSKWSFLGWTLGSAGTAKFWAMLSFFFLTSSAVPFCFLMYGFYGLLIGIEGLAMFFLLLRCIEARRKRVQKGIDAIANSHAPTPRWKGTLNAALNAMTVEKQYEHEEHVL